METNWNREEARMHLRIEAGPAQGRVPAKAVARVFDGLQDILFLIGDDILGSKPRAKGNFPSAVREAFVLQVSALKFGSVDVEFTIPAGQATLDGPGRHAHEALRRANLLFGILHEPAPTHAELAAVAQNPIRRRRILQQVEGIVSPSDEYRVSGVVAGKAVRIGREMLPAVRQLLLTEPMHADRVVIGRVTMLSVDKKREFVVDPTDSAPIHVKYPREAEEAMREVFGRLAELHLEHKDGKTFQILAAESVTRLNAIPIDSFTVLGETKEFHPPVNFEFQVDEAEQYLAENEELGIVAAAKNMPDLIKEIKDQLAEIWEIYVEAEEGDLAPDALDLRAHLLRLAGEAP